MTTPLMTCDEFAQALGEYLEGDAVAAVRARVDAHAAACAECRALLGDLQRIEASAAALPPLAPARDLWAGIAQRIETPVVELTPSGHTNEFAVVPMRRRSQMWIGLAAAGLVAVTATVTHQLTKRAIAPVGAVAAVPAPAHAPAPTRVAAVDSSTRDSTTNRASVGARSGASASLVSDARRVESPYDAEIARLRAVVAARRSSLDTATVNVIDRNLKIIDVAIEQCREALRKDPASRFLLESLDDALGTKVQLLRTATALPAKA